MRPGTAARLLVTLLAGAFVAWLVAIVVSVGTFIALLVRTNRRMNRHIAAVRAERDDARAKAARWEAIAAEQHAATHPEPMATVLTFPGRGA